MPEAIPRPGRKCAKGHAMDPSWEECPYCEAEQRSKQRTVESVDPSDRHRTRIGPVPQNPPEANRLTRPIAGPVEQGGHGGASETRRITGVLVTYTWQPGGEVHVIREGKNFIGSGDVSSETPHRTCDIQVQQDPTMSAEHALILCRQGNYEILDQISTNGTFLAGQMLRANVGADLPNNAEIKTGSTLWTFIKVSPSAGPQNPPPAQRSPSPDTRPGPEKPTEVR
jgi:pSer/pThr/pTyr-binding forkhead associated (FHA) protein